MGLNFSIYIGSEYTANQLACAKHDFKARSYIEFLTA